MHWGTFLTHNFCRGTKQAIFSTLFISALGFPLISYYFIRGGRQFAPHIFRVHSIFIHQVPLCLQQGSVEGARGRPATRVYAMAPPRAAITSSPWAPDQVGCRAVASSLPSHRAAINTSSPSLALAREPLDQYPETNSVQ